MNPLTVVIEQMRDVLIWGKLPSWSGCTAGEVFDGAVDIRRDSPTFGKWVGAILSEENKLQMWIPPGLAHGFLVLSSSADFLYKTTEYYAPQHERAVLWNDPDLAIDWPLSRAPLLSAKDLAAPSFKDAHFLLYLNHL